MFASILRLLPLLILLTVFLWLTRKAWRLQNPALRWVVSGLLGAIPFALTVLLVLSAIGLYQIYSVKPNPVTAVSVAQTPERIERGEKLAMILCAECHSTNNQLPLSGGSNMSYVPGETVIPSNLTPGGDMANWTDGDLVRVIREGIGRDGRSRVIMAYTADRFRHLSDDDVQSIVAFLRSQPSVSNATPTNDVLLLFPILVATGQFEQTTNSTGWVVAPSRDEPVAHGDYLVNIAGCRGCHALDLSGGNGVPGLRTSATQWSQAQFIEAMRTGVTPEGRVLNPQQMPWPDIAQFDDTELAAMYQYLNSLPLSR